MTLCLMRSRVNLWVMPEADFQDKFLAKATDEGYLAQRLSDGVAVGIPDVFIGSPFYGVWLELKWVDWPKKPDTPLLILGSENKRALRGPQYQFLRLAWKRPCDSGVLIGSPDGWLAVPTPAINKYLLAGGNGDIHHRPYKEAPTMALIRDMLRMEMWRG